MTEKSRELLSLGRLGVFLALFMAATSSGRAPAYAAQGVETPSTKASSHDWRTPGFVSVIGGNLYDAACVPLASVGINAPNLPYRSGASENVEFMRANQIRWIRVFATGHALEAGRSPADASAAAASLKRLLDFVAASNAAAPPEQSIYVLISLTDYYPTGVPGDRHAYDHPNFRDVPVLPAPWYRAGTSRFSFEQEHGQGLLSDMPNYEVFYKPWVQEIVAALADSPALLGWQLGNELKARNSPRNDISPQQAYGWYLDFTRDMVDTIRDVDQNHLIFLGAQYMAELVDWDYRDRNGRLQESMLPTYHGLVQQALEACNAYCWNVWGLSGYDLNLFTLDDATAFRRAAVASVVTEFGHTREIQGDTQQLFNGNRASAVRSGFAAQWTDIEGTTHPRAWSVEELFEEAGLASIAPWGSPAPGQEATLDADTGRGITYAPDETQLWAAWHDVATRRESANRAAGPSDVCLGTTTTQSATRVQDQP